MKIGVIPDLHLKERLGYGDYVADGRVAEKEQILSFIKKELYDCDKIVFVGDQFQSRNNPSSVIREFTNLVESFDKQEIFIVSGNHEQVADRTAIDYLKEIKNPRWHIITDSIEVVGDLVFSPYFHRNKFGTTDNAAATAKLLKALKPGKILFAHQAVANSKIGNGDVTTSILDEIVLPIEALNKKYKLSILGHIHTPQLVDESTIVVGSVFCNEVGETEKFLWKIDEKTLKAEKIKIPGRGIYRLENPDPDGVAISKVATNNIIKVILTKKYSKKEIESLREGLEKFDGYVLLEQIPSERKTTLIGGTVNVLDLSIEKLLEIYSQQHDINLDKLKEGFELITKL